jgi:hypothetical protein
VLHNPYAPPLARVEGVSESDEFSFDPSREYKLTPKQLRVAAYCTLASAVLSLPLIGLTIYSMFDKSLTWNIAILVTDVATTMLFVYPLWIQRRLLNEKSGIFNVDRIITLLIASMLLMLLLTGINTWQSRSLVGASISVMGMIAYGIVFILYALKLLQCKDTMYGHLKPLAYVSLASGVLMVTVLLALIAVPLGFAYDVLLSMIFFKAAKELTSVEAGR